LRTKAIVPNLGRGRYKGSGSFSIIQPKVFCSLHPCPESLADGRRWMQRYTEDRGSKEFFINR
jgi:hypothetical protein